MQGVFNAIGQFFTDILSYIANFAKFITSSFTQIFLDIWEVLTDIVPFFIEVALNIAVGFFETVSFTVPTSLWSSLPSDLINVLGLIGLKEALTIIVSSLFIRFTLQLIPFVRLGS